MTGKFYGLGVGPGDPELITLKARRILQEVPVLAVPTSSECGRSSLALEVVKQFIRPEQETLYLFLPMSRDPAYLKGSWKSAAEKLVDKLREGKDVAFLTLGDASLYSTYSYLVEMIRKLDPGVSVETVPGITSFSAAAARLNIPLATGEEPLAIIPALQKPEILEELIPRFPNLVLMKVARHYDDIVRILARTGVVKNAVLATRCGQEGESFSWDLEAGVGQKQDYLSLIIVKGRDGA
ncbi:MAG: precorrin-2 C(20)-methyltransferase [Moorellaceae bacterium]